MPATAEDLSKVYGIGRARLTTYGPELLDIVRQHLDLQVAGNDAAVA